LLDWDSGYNDSLTGIVNTVTDRLGYSDR